VPPKSLGMEVVHELPSESIPARLHPSSPGIADYYSEMELDLALTPTAPENPRTNKILSFSWILVAIALLAVTLAAVLGGVLGSRHPVPSPTTTSNATSSPTTITASQTSTSSPLPNGIHIYRQQYLDPQVTTGSHHQLLSKLS